jgi:hypothetical protein
MRLSFGPAASLAAAVILSLTAAAAPAPPQAQPQPARPVASQTPSAGRPASDERFGQPTAPILLLCWPDVRADLGLSTEQAEGAERAAIELRRRAAALKGKRDVLATEAKRAINQDQWAWIKANLSPEQRTRLVQVNLQWQGVASLKEPVIADTLGLTPEQRAGVAAAVGRRDEARARGAYSAADGRTLTETIDALLTPPQKERWRAMLGRPFTPQLSSARDPSDRPRR